MTNGYTVYCYTNSVNGKKYVGCTQMTLQKRAGTGGCNYKGSPYFYAAIKSYGWDKFSADIIASGLKKSEAASMEKEYITKYDTMNPCAGYNLHRGGFVTKELSEAFKMDRASRISSTLKRERGNDEYRAIMAERMRKVWADPRRREAILKARAEATPGGRRPIVVKCMDTGEVFPSVKAACRKLGLWQPTVSHAFSKGLDTVSLKSKTLNNTVTIIKYRGITE